MFKKFTLPCMLALLTQLAWAQQKNAVITGQVSGEDGMPIPAANVVLEGTVYGTFTDEAGKYVLRHLPAGTYQLKVIQIGFRSTGKKVQLQENESLALSFELAPRENKVAEVEVFGVRDQQLEKLDAITRLPLKPSDQIQSISVISDRLIRE